MLEFIDAEGRQRCAATIAAYANLSASGEIGPNTLVRRPGDDRWLSLSAFAASGGFQESHTQTLPSSPARTEIPPADSQIYQDPFSGIGSVEVAIGSTNYLGVKASAKSLKAQA